MYAHVCTCTHVRTQSVTYQTKNTLHKMHHNPIFQCQHVSASNLSPNLFGVRSLAISLHGVPTGLWQCSLRATRAFAVSSSPCLLYSSIVRRRLFGGNHRYLEGKKGERRGRERRRGGGAEGIGAREGRGRREEGEQRGEGEGRGGEGRGGGRKAKERGREEGEGEGEGGRTRRREGRRRGEGRKERTE